MKRIHRIFDRKISPALLSLLLLVTFPAARAMAQSGLKTIDPPQGGMIVYGQVDGQSTEAGAMGAILKHIHDSMGDKPQGRQALRCQGIAIGGRVLHREAARWRQVGGNDHRRQVEHRPCRSGAPERRRTTLRQVDGPHDETSLRSMASAADLRQRSRRGFRTSCSRRAASSGGYTGPFGRHLRS